LGLQHERESASNGLIVYKGKPDWLAKKLLIREKALIENGKGRKWSLINE
jgi:hypothetical protein